MLVCGCVGGCVCACVYLCVYVGVCECVCVCVYVHFNLIITSRLSFFFIILCIYFRFFYFTCSY